MVSEPSPKCLVRGGREDSTAISASRRAAVPCTAAVGAAHITTPQQRRHTCHTTRRRWSLPRLRPRAGPTRIA